MNDILHRLALRSYPSHRHNHSTSSVKFYNMSIIDKIRDLRKEIIGKLIKSKVFFYKSQRSSNYSF